jgi:Na+/melibiose symporter-like transporter
LAQAASSAVTGATPESGTDIDSADRLGGPLPLRLKLSYGLGEMAEGVKTAALETFLFFYYVQVIGLSGSLVGLALLIALLFDGITDPLIGNFSDGIRSRLGRRHPFLYLAPVPLGIALYLLFAPPAGLGEWGLFAWLLGFTAFSRLMQSLYFVPHMALGAELSTDFKERISVSSYRNIFAFAGRLLVLWLAFSIFFRPVPGFPQGQLNGAGYPPFALACAGIALAAILVSAAGTQRRAITVYHALTAAGEPARDHVLGNLVKAFRLRSFAIFFVAILISYVLGGVQAALGVHVNTFYWELPATGVQSVFFGTAFGFMAGSLFARPLADRLDKKIGYVGSVVTSVAINVSPIALSQIGLFPDDGWLLTPLLTAFAFFAGLAGGPAMVIAAAMLADIADEYELHYRGRAEGFLFGASAFTRKASLGLGGAFAGVALDLIHFPRGAGVTQVPRDAAVDLAILYGPALFVFTAVSMSIMMMYDLTREKHARILKQLERRR